MPCNCNNSLQQYNSKNYNYSQSANQVQDRQLSRNDGCDCHNCKQKYYVEKSARKEKSKRGCGCGCNDCECKQKDKVNSTDQKNTKRCDKCRHRKCQCVKYVPCFKTKCGIISASLTKTAFPTFYTTVGQIITYTYTITNTGDVPICDPIRICDDHLGGQIIPGSFILPGTSQSYTRTYTILPSDLLIPGITNIATAYIEVDCKCWVATCPASATVTFGSADLFGTISQALVLGAPTGTVEVTVTISNSALSATSAENVSLTLPFPADISGVIESMPPPTLIGPSSVSYNIASLAIGASSSFRFRYTAGSTITGASYVFAGTILASTFDPNPSNNFLSSTFVFP